MGLIKDSSSYFNRSSVTILMNDNDEDIENGITFSSYDSLFGDFATQWDFSENPPHLTQWCEEYGNGITLQSSLHTRDQVSSNEFTLLTDRIKVGEVSWGISSNCIGEASFLDGYWEWLEDVISRNKDALVRADVYKAVYASLFTYDCSPKVIRAFCERWCPSTNTLHTSIGELSISLWDLRKLGGLPIRGQIYDEVVPSVKELLGSNERNERSLPRSCKFLFRAFAKLCNKDGKQVSMSSWVHFWYRRPSTYRPPSARVHRKDAGCPRATRNPTGVIDAPSERSALDNAPFIELDIRDSIKDEVYLAALLSCWLCKFVLPSKEVNFIRPSVFKVASVMASGMQISLAIPVLASIYNGLRAISTSSSLKSCVTSLPVHYVYAWLGQYFHTHYYKERIQNTIVPMATYAGEKMGKYFSASAAWDLFRNVDHTSLHSLSWCRETKQVLVDDESLTMNCSEYFISHRSCYLTMRRDNEYIFELYSPHRFSVQFGYYQDIPGGLTKDFLAGTTQSAPQDLSTGTLQDVYQMWESCVRTGTRSKLTIPPRPLKGGRLTSSRYNEWWSKRRNKTFLKPNKIILKGHAVVPKIPMPNKTNLCKLKEIPVPVLLPNVQEETLQYRVATSSERTRSQTPIYRPYSKPLAMAGGCKEKFQRDDDRSSSEDRHWKRKRIEPVFVNDPSFPTTIDADTFFEGVPSSSMPIAEVAKEGASESLLSAENGESIQGPHSRDLLVKQIEGSLLNAQASEKTIERLPLIRAPLEFNLSINDELPLHTSVCSEHVYHTKSKFADHPEASIFCAATVVSEGRRLLAMSLWESLQHKIARTPLDRVSLLVGEAKCMIDAIAENKDIDYKPLRIMVDSFFQQIDRLSVLQTNFAEKMTLEVQAKHLGMAIIRLNEARAIEDDEANRNEFIRDKQASNRSRRAELMLEMEKLDMEDKELEPSFQQSNIELSEKIANTSEIGLEIGAIENASILGDSDTKQLKLLEEMMKTTYEELKNYKWSP